MKKIFTDYASYNLWANRRLAKPFLLLDEETLNRHVETSYPSAKLTLLHIWDAELIWLQRLQGISLNHFPSRDFTGTTEDAVEGLLGNSADLLHFLEVQDEAFFEKNITSTSLSHGEQQQPASQMIHHCLNHSTYHRGQLVTIGRQLGLTTIPVTDMIYYYRVEDRQ